MQRRMRAALTLALIGLPAALGAAPARAAARTPGVADLDGDGYGDLVIGAPAASGGGRVTVVYGSRNGVDLGRHRVLAPLRSGGAFGTAVATADFDGDGRTDLAVGAPGRGTIEIFAGSRSGLSRRAVLTPGGGAGRALAVGDVDHDGRPDLLVAGDSALLVIGFATGVPTVVATVKGRTARRVAIAAGDVNGDGYADAAWNADGVLRILHGSRTGLRAVSGTASVGSTGGLAIADVNGDRRGDVVAGDPGGAHGGLVKIYPGGDLRHSRAYGQDSKGVPGKGEKGDEFGAAVVARDRDGDGRAEVVVGAPGEAIGKRRNAGAVTVLRGDTHWNLGAGSSSFSQDTEGVPGVAEAGDRYGAALSLADLDGDTRLDLAVGTPGENDGDGGVSIYPGQGIAGMTVFGGRSAGLSAAKAAFGASLSG
ncbi:FG-GAP repeat domain-containing protein [Actinoallomurus rhizosphaericola]|uniref:FG-GAP repeat domain-containing protein n=1 Tax=Actinoallomurus rhizosphaericola TaxID=2952536 RepID=UPI002091AD0D|nr:FG-GAP and VCBS repeat-containing protein [Actinoallomurus rhizosphaericola]MCO5993103.1 VCBS repeat-containing protein [Actinoallomurus rhizosphaericola]